MEGLRSQNVSGCSQDGLSRRAMFLLQWEAGYGEEPKCCQAGHVTQKHMAPCSLEMFMGAGLCPGLTGVWGLDHEMTKGELL